MNDKEKIKRFIEKDSGDELSPFDPPDAYDPQNIEKVEYENYHSFIKELIDEHKQLTIVLNDFEKALIDWRTNNWIFTKIINEKFKSFFSFIDEKTPLHNKKEEKVLFPLLNKKLIEIGEYNSQDSEITGIDVMEDEHLKVAQASAIVFNFLGLGSRLSDIHSKDITFTAAFDQGLAIVETMRLHIFREENILFAQSKKLLDWSKFAANKN